LLLMSLYLDNASLPSPCWMITGAMARVCQDVALDKNPPPNLLSEVELESRRRLFWAAYIHERKECLKKGRAVIMHDGDVEVPLPKVLEEETRTNMGESGDGDKQLPSNPSDCVPRNSQLTAEQSHQVMTAQIHISMLCSTLMAVRITDNGGSQDLQRIQDLDHKLKCAWDGFPSHFTDLQKAEPLDIGAIRPLFYLQYCRLLLYRFFTEPTLNLDFRTFCLAQSIQVSKISAHLIFRASRNDACFGMRTEELTHLQTLRTAVILLIGHCAHHEPALLSVSKEEVETCIGALRSISAIHARGKKLLAVFEGFARSFGYESSAPPVPQNTETAVATPVEVKQEIPTTTAASQSIEFIPPPPPLQCEFGQNYIHTNTSSTSAPLFGTQYVPVNDWPDPTMQVQTGADFRLPSFGDLGPEIATNQRERTMSIGDLRLNWEAVQQTLQFGDGAVGAGGNMNAISGQPGTGFWGWP
ncbi:hypothetical protein BDD12DRAFT_740638, partial [Trichophaea hybrida]